MSISEIVNYVNRTPHNTNPNVIASMVQGANEQAVYESVEKLKQDGGVGYTEKSVFTFDGNTEGKLKYPGMPLYKISDKIPDFSTFSKLVGIMGGVELEAFAGDVVIENGDLGATLSINISGRAVVLAMVYHDESGENTGLYLFSYGGEYISCIEFEDTVHTIESKYLPEPVKINLMNYGIDIVSATLAGGGAWTVNRPDFWDVVHANRDRDIRFIANLNGVDYQLLPSVIAFGDRGGNVGMNLMACMSDKIMINANVVFVYDFGGNGTLDKPSGVACYVTVTQTPVPT